MAPEDTRRVAITKKVSLAEVADGWEECYAVVSLANFNDLTELDATDLDKMKTLDIVKFEIGVVEKHFVSGKILLTQPDGTVALADMLIDDIKSSPRLIDLLYSEIMGLTLDPKDTSKVATNNSAPTSDSNTTKTT